MTTKERQLHRKWQSRRRMCGLLNARISELMHEIEELETANANLRIERDAADVLLGEAMDAAREWRTGKS